MLAQCSRFARGSLCLLALILGGCGGVSDAPTLTAPPPAAPAPTALEGTWVGAAGAAGEQVTLTLSESGYRIARGLEEGRGTIAVSGDRIDFSRANVRTGSGAYRWRLTGDALVFIAVTTDACPVRSEVLVGYTYTKSR